jgi:hypothetical protein
VKAVVCQRKKKKEIEGKENLHTHTHLRERVANKKEGSYK